VSELPNPFLDQLTLDEQLTHDVPHARADDPWTSKRAGIEIEHEEGATSLIRPATNKHLALRTLASTPSTGIEVERLTGRRGLWKRVSDLKKPGLIEEVDVRIDPQTRRPGLVCALTEKGRRVLAQLDAGQEVRV
jgi:hypothetical protein